MGLLFGDNSSQKRSIRSLGKPDSGKSVPFSNRKFEKSLNPKPTGFLDTLFSKQTQVDKTTKEVSKTTKSILEKRKEGLTWSELESEAKKRSLFETQLKESDRAGAISEMKKEKNQKYGQYINEKELNDYIDHDLKKKKYSELNEKDRLLAKHKQILLEKIKEKKI